MEWQPMKTAPEGTRVLLKLADGGLTTARKILLSADGVRWWVSDKGPFGDEIIMTPPRAWKYLK